MPTREQAREWYEPDDPVHGFDHVERVVNLALLLAKEEGADPRVVEAAAWLHDVAGSSPTAVDGDGGRSQHEISSAHFARQVLKREAWDERSIEAVVHCVMTHRYRGRLQPESIEAKVLFDADKLDVLGAFGVARTIGYAVQAGQPCYAPVSEQFKESGKLLPEEPHSAYHEYLFKLRHVSARLFTDTARRMAADRSRLLTLFFEQLKAEAERQI